MSVRYQQRRRAKHSARLARFAEMLAEGMTISEAAQALGVSQQSGSQYFASIRRALGQRAV